MKPGVFFDPLWHPTLCAEEQSVSRLKRSHIVPKIVKLLAEITEELPRYYECGCGFWHPVEVAKACEFEGPCFTESCFTHDDLDAKYGVYGWIAVDQSEVDS